MTPVQKHEFIFSLEKSERLDVTLSKNVPGLSRSQAKNLIEKGCVRCRGIVADKGSLLVETGDVIEVEIPASKRLDLSPIEVEGVRVVYEDEDIAVIEKPHGVSVHPATTHNEPTLVHDLLGRLGPLSGIGGIERPGIVHRIDKGTSGLLVVSKSDRAHLALSKMFKDHALTRAYQTLVYGNVAAKLKKTAGRIETLYGRDPKNRKKMTGKVKSGRIAVTNWKVMSSFGDSLTLVECRLETGRTHQIRVHLSESGFSVVGDPIYGDHHGKAAALAKRVPSVGRPLLALDHQLLHAYLLEFEHPVSRKVLRFESPLPKDFQESVDRCQVLNRES